MTYSGKLHFNHVMKIVIKCSHNVQRPFHFSCLNNITFGLEKILLHANYPKMFFKIYFLYCNCSQREKAKADYNVCTCVLSLKAEHT